MITHNINTHNMITHNIILTIKASLAHRDTLFFYAILIKGIRASLAHRDTLFFYTIFTQGQIPKSINQQIRKIKNTKI